MITYIYSYSSECQDAVSVRDSSKGTIGLGFIVACMTKTRRFIDFTGSFEAVLPNETPPGLPKLSGYHPTGPSDAIVIDAGSWQFRAGYASKDLPARKLRSPPPLSYFLTKPFRISGV